MSTAWYYPTFIVVVAGVLVGLLFAIWKVWRAEIRVRLIPKAEIQTAAQKLIRQQGTGQAEYAAHKLSLDAWHRLDPVEAGRWERVARSIRQSINEELVKNETTESSTDGGD